jgi:hypothetical protein
MGDTASNITSIHAGLSVAKHMFIKAWKNVWFAVA